MLCLRVVSHSIDVHTDALQLCDVDVDFEDSQHSSLQIEV